MDLATIEMDRSEAREAYEDYVAALKRRHTDEDAAIAEGYKALAEGRKVISLQWAIRAGGVDERGFPKLAAARANYEWCYVDRRMSGAVNFSISQRGTGNGRGNSAGVVRLPDGTLPDISGYAWHGFNHETQTYDRNGLRWTVGDYRYRSMIPVVPPRLRPTRALTTYHVLWEAEWGKAPAPPGDPALLKHISGDLWAVLAEWDLTPLERAVLAQRRV